jgi:hypothetical protein
MYCERQLAPLVDQVYDATLNAEAWPRALTAIAQALGGRLPVLYHHDSRAHKGAIFLTAEWEPAPVQAYNDYYVQRNVWLKRAETVLKSERLRTSHMMCSRRELLRSEYYAGWLVPLGISQAIGATLLASGSNSSNITVMAGAERANFGDEDREFLGALLPHLARALQIRERLEEGARRERALMEALHECGGQLARQQSGGARRG